MPKIKLQTNDNQIFVTDIKVARLAGTIKTVMEDCGMEEGDDMVVPLPNVSAAILKRFITWAEHHKDDPPSDEDEKKERRTDDISSWDVDFLKVDQGNFQ